MEIKLVFIKLNFYPVFSSSNNLKTFSMSSLLSLSEILAVIKSKNSLNSIYPEPSASRSDII